MYSVNQSLNSIKSKRCIYVKELNITRVTLYISIILVCMKYLGGMTNNRENDIRPDAIIQLTRWRRRGIASAA